MPSKKKKYNARFPAGRIKKIMQTDEEVGKVAQAVPVIISRTLELFVESLLSKSLEVTQARCAKTLTPSHLKHCILAEARFDFLRDLVKNIPDISPAEDTNQGPSADSSPRSHEPAPTAGEPSTSYRKPRQPAKKDNGQSSDSGSDYEPPKQKNQFRNGRNIPTRQYNGAYAADEQRYDRIRMDLPVTSTIPSREAKPVDLSLSTNSLPHNSLAPSSTITQQNPHLARLPNFYTETLKDTNDDEEVKPPVYSSVIQPNPEYGGRPSPVASQNVPFGTYGKDKLSVAGRSSSFKDPSEYGKFDEPRLRIDLDSASAKLPRQNSAPSNYSSLSGTPLFHFDLSKLPITSNKLDEAPFTPTLLHQPLTPLLPGESSKYFQNPASDSSMKYLSPPKKGPPPALQTLKRKSLLSEALKSNTLEKIEEVSVPKIHIDLSQAQAGHVPKFHLDLTNYNFEAPLSSSVASCGTTPKRKKSLASNEPPPLLPIESLQKNTDFKFGKSSPKKAADLIDDDYDA